MQMARGDTAGTAPAFAALLKIYRTQAGISQEQLAERAGVSVSAIGAHEQGLRRAPYRETIDRLCDALALGAEDRKRLHDAANAARARVPRAARPASVRLPMPFTTFIARPEVDEIAGLLERRRFVTITGAGGIGKTRTAVAAARRLARSGMDCCFVDLSAVGDENGVWLAIAAACEMSAHGDESVAAAVCKQVSLHPLLLVLDNCEHIVDAAAAAAQTLIAAASSLRLLTTSRERLGLSSELVFRLPSMATPTALQLLVERADAADAHADEAFADSDLLIEICRMLEGIPLAIELAAFHLASLGPEAVRARLRDGLALLGPRDLPQRHQTMTAAIAWSFDLLDPIERTVIERIGVFVGGFTIAAAQHIAADDEISAGDIDVCIMRLVQKSLVQVEQTEASTRYALLETVRAYANQQLALRGASAEISRRHLHWLADLALEFSHARPRRSTATLYCEMENIRSALKWAIASNDARDAHAAGTIAGRLRLVWYTLERSAELQSWAERLLPMLRESDHAEVMAHLYAALVNCSLREPEAVIRHGERAVRLARQSGDLELALTVSGQIAIPLVQRGRGDEAEAMLAAGDDWLASPAASGTFNRLAILANRISVRRWMENFDFARADIARILELPDAGSDPEHAHRTKALMQLAAVEFATGDVRTAARIVQEIVDARLSKSGEPALWLAIAHGELGSYYLALEEISAAERHLLGAVRMLCELGTACEVFFLYIGCILARRGDGVHAAQMLGFVDSWYERTGFTMGRADLRFRASLAASLSSLLRSDEIAALSERGAAQSFDDMAALLTR